IEEEKEMIHSIFDFADTMVRKVMTPRIDITAIESGATTDELVVVINASGHSRILVYQGDLDNILGVVYAKDLLREIEVKGKAPSLSKVMREPYFIPENKRVNDLLREFRRKRLQMAIVRDEYGTVSGLVTVEDLLEEIVGDIGDEYDVEEPLVQTINENTWMIDGRLSLDDFNDRMGARLPSQEADTVGGYVFGLLGHMPDEGEWVQQDSMIFRVAATDGKRVTQVRVERCEDERGGLDEAGKMDQSAELSNEESQEGMRNSDCG
ncbi:MAG: hemolysin family protein, partial [Armatimonadetes bacterium]|nr:hemolysin family protein [Armatimonadota bacterium]